IEPAAETRRSVLLIYGEARPVPAVASFDQAIRSVLQSGITAPLHVYTESLDSSWAVDPRVEEALANTLALKYAGRTLDVVMPCLDSAIRFTLRYRDRIFRGVPIVFCGSDQAIRDTTL